VYSVSVCMCKEKDDRLRFGIEIRVKLRGFGGRDKSAILIPRRKNRASSMRVVGKKQ